MGSKSVLVAAGIMAAFTAAPVAEAAPTSAPGSAPAPASALQRVTAERYPHGLRGTSFAGPPRKARKSLATRAVAGHWLSIEVLDRLGRAPATEDAGTVTIVDVERDEWLSAEVTDGHAEVQLPAGKYAVMTQVKTREGATHSTSLVYLPDLSVRGNSRLVLDARKARPVTPKVDRKDARVLHAAVQISQAIGGGAVGAPPGRGPIAILEGPNIHVTPTGPMPGLTMQAQAVLTRNGVVSGSPYVYAIAHATVGRIGDPGVRVRAKDLAAVRTRYGSEGKAACGGGHYGVDPGTGLVIGSYVGVGKLPAVRTEYFTPGFTWSNDSMVTTPDCSFEFDATDVRNRGESFPRGAGYRREWNIGLLGPSRGMAIWGTGEGEPALAVPMLSTWDTYSTLAPYAGATGQSVLRNEKGEVLAISDHPGTAHNWPAPAPGTYTLTLEAERKAPWSSHPTRQRTVLTFRVEDDRPAPLPGVRLSTPLDLQNRARPMARQPITLAADGVPTLRVSFDDGKTWVPAAVRRSGEHWTAIVRNPASGHVSLHVVVPGAVDQTMIRAYGVR